MKHNAPAVNKYMYAVAYRYYLNLTEQPVWDFQEHSLVILKLKFKKHNC